MAALAAIVLPFLLLPDGPPSSPADTLLVEGRFFGTFLKATRISADSRGQVFVLDEARDLLIHFDGDQREVSIGGRGWDGSSFDRPTGMATDGLSLYVSDYGNHRVSRFDRRLTFISALSTRDSAFVPARFGYPAGVALSRQGDLFVLDGENLRVVKFNAQSRFERSFGDREALRGRLRDPRKILVSRFDQVFVLEKNRIVEFDYAGNFVRDFADGIFSDATGVSETRAGVVVSTKRMLLWFDRTGKLTQSMNVELIVSSAPLIPVQDVAVAEDRLYILTPTRVGIFKMVY